MFRSHVMAEVAAEIGLIEPGDVPILLSGYGSAAEATKAEGEAQLSFEQWAIATGVLTAREIVRLLDRFQQTTFTCGSCGSSWSGSSLPHDESAACAQCGSTELEREGKPVSASAGGGTTLSPPTADPGAIAGYDLDELNTPGSMRRGSDAAAVPDALPAGASSGGRPLDAATAADAASYAHALAPGQVLGGCRIQRELGRGGMGVVYLALQTDLDRPVVIKVLSAEFKTDSPQMLRFRREARAIARLHHENVVAVHHLGEAHGRPCLIMEFVDGESAYEYLRRLGRVPWKEAMRIGHGVAHGLMAAHEAGIVHRDVKPGNILLGKDGAVKLVDFGLAKELDQDPSVPKLSRSGFIIGTPWYLAPEQVEGLEVTGAADIYALGISLWHMIVGELPFTGPMVQVVMHQLNSPLPSVSARVPDVPADAEAFIERMTSKARDDRPSMPEVMRALGRLAGIEDSEGDAGAVHTAGAAAAPSAPASTARARAERRDSGENKITALWMVVAVLAIIAAVLLAAVAIILSQGTGAPADTNTDSGAAPSHAATAALASADDGR